MIDSLPGRAGSRQATISTGRTRCRAPRAGTARRRWAGTGCRARPTRRAPRCRWRRPPAPPCRATTATRAPRPPTARPTATAAAAAARSRARRTPRRRLGAPPRPGSVFFFSNSCLTRGGLRGARGCAVALPGPSVPALTPGLTDAGSDSGIPGRTRASLRLPTESLRRLPLSPCPVVLGPSALARPRAAGPPLRLAASEGAHTRARTHARTHATARARARRSVFIYNCTPVAGYYGLPPAPIAACPPNTTAMAGAAARTDCRPLAGYYGALGEPGVRCPEASGGCVGGGRGGGYFESVRVCVCVCVYLRVCVSVCATVSFLSSLSLLSPLSSLPPSLPPFVCLPIWVSLCLRTCECAPVRS